MKKFLQALSVGLVFLVICGFAYPLFVLGIGQLAFHKQANGSMIEAHGKVVGSELIGQDFKDSRFFHGRVSAVNYNTFPADTSADKLLPGSGSANYAVSNKDLERRIKTDVEAFIKDNADASADVSEKNLPADLFTSSFSGLDPDISPASAEVQVDRIMKATGLSKDKIEQIIKNNTAARDLGLLGETRINVLKANLAIYRLLQEK